MREIRSFWKRCIFSLCGYKACVGIGTIGKVVGEVEVVESLQFFFRGSIPAQVGSGGHEEKCEKNQCSNLDTWNREVIGSSWSGRYIQNESQFSILLASFIWESRCHSKYVRNQTVFKLLCNDIIPTSELFREHGPIIGCGGRS